MCIRVTIDTIKPLKRAKKIRHPARKIPVHVSVQVSGHNYVSHLVNEGSLVRAVTEIRAEEEAELDIMEERKRRKKMLQDVDEEANDEMEANEESPIKLLKSI
ncbi:hypothetical protein LINGRAHAP2_LOCUS31314 [Linum grandiflorum]